jgi:hypothetical protein
MPSRFLSRWAIARIAAVPFKQARAVRHAEDDLKQVRYETGRTPLTIG